MPNCPECTAREKKKIQAKYEAEVAEEEEIRRRFNKLFDEIDIPMKMDEKNRNISFVKDVVFMQLENKFQILDSN